MVLIDKCANFKTSLYFFFPFTLCGGGTQILTYRIMLLLVKSTTLRKNNLKLF